MGQVDPRVPRCRRQVSSDLDQAPTLGPVGDHDEPAGVSPDDDLVALHGDPHAGALQLRRHRVPHRPERHRLVRGDDPGLPEGCRVGFGGDPVQELPLHDECFVGAAAGGLVDPAVDLAHELCTRVGELVHRRVLGAQVRLLRQQVRLRDLHRRLHPTLGLRVVGHARVHRGAVIASDVDHQRVPDRHPRNVLHGDRLGVVGQHVVGDATDQPEHRVQTRRQRLRRLVPAGDHHPEPGPGHPSHEQHRRTEPTVEVAHLRPVTPVDLAPHPRHRDPRPVRTGVLEAPAGLRCRDRPAGRPLGPLIATRHQLLVRHIGADRAVGPVDQLHHQVGVPVHQAGPLDRRIHAQPSLPTGHQPADRLRVTPRQLRSAVRALRLVECFQDFHCLFAVLLHGVGPLPQCSQHRRAIRTDTTGEGRHAVDPNKAGRSAGHGTGDHVTAREEINWPPTRRLRWPWTAG